jgi:hypothetical protein
MALPLALDGSQAGPDGWEGQTGVPARIGPPRGGKRPWRASWAVL